MGTNLKGLGKNYGREGVIVVIAVFVSVLVGWLLYYLFLRLPQPGTEPRTVDVVKLVYTDANVFHQLYMRWTVVDWVLTFLATGTAIGAVIKNSNSVKSEIANNLSWVDKLLIILAVLTVLATTFDGKLHAGQLADRYRAGDLILQAATAEYAGSQKQDEDKALLLKRWKEALGKLGSSSPAVQEPVSDTTPPKNPPSQPGSKPETTPGKQTDDKSPPPNPAQHQ